jgi:hypothetical protein
MVLILSTTIISTHLSRRGEAEADELETDAMLSVLRRQACWHLHTIVKRSPAVSNPRGAITFATHYMLAARTIEGRRVSADVHRIRYYAPLQMLRQS